MSLHLNAISHVADGRKDARDSAVVARVSIEEADLTSRELAFPLR